MEALYAKLYNKYDSLKKKRISELDEINKDQEVNFLNYVSAAEELIQHVRTENDKLSAQVNELRSQITLIRSTKDDECAQYQKLLMEETQKNKILSEEVDRLQNLQEQPSSSSRHNKNDNKQLMTLQSARVISGELSSDSTRMTRKRSREARAQLEGLSSPDRSNQSYLLQGESAKETTKVRKSSRLARAESEGFITPDGSNQDGLLARESAKDLSRLTSSIEDLANQQQRDKLIIQPACCGGTVSGGGDVHSGSTNCQFQALTECLLGMKLSTSNQTEGICISALHQSSGYSFSLTWVQKASGEEPELLYRVLTLGTFEQVAPEWMRSVLMFSTSMCPIFFKRVNNVIKGHQ